MSRTPGFEADRLRQAREARGLSMTNLAELVDISRESISKYERGDATPGPDIMRRISDRLGMPQSFFVQPIDRSAKRSAVFFRSMSTAGVSARKRAAVLYEWVYEIARTIQRYVDLPDATVPKLDIVEPTALSNERIEAYATEVRRQWGMGDGPISDVVLLLENHGILVARAPLELEKLDGLSGWFNERPVVLLNSDKETGARSRLDAAHELGHLVLHRNVEQAAIHTSKTFKLIEDQAFRFGASFLLPARSFALEANPLTLDHLVDLKQRWRVSIAMMIQRATHLRMLDENSAKYMWRKYAFNRWSRGEPLDDTLPIERPRLLPRAIDMLISARVMSRADLPARLHLAPLTVERLAGLTDGFLGEDAQQVVPIQPKLRPVPFVDDAPSGRVLTFRPKG